jgi:hypothetical protein
MSLTFMRKAPARYALLDARLEVGWLTKHSIGLCGFASAKEARSAGEIASRALAGWLDARRADDARLSRSSMNNQWSRTGGVSEFGVPPPVYVTRCGAPRTFAFEIPLPRDALFAIAVHAVQVVYSALGTSGMAHATTPAGAVAGSDAT